MTRFFTLIAFLFFSIISNAQVPVLKSDMTIGGNGFDNLQTILPIAQGKLILCGASTSGISGEKSTASYGNQDIWIIQLAADSSIDWQTVIGGTGDEEPRDIIQTSDGGFLILGYSDSPVSGNKTDSLYGMSDYFLVKINNLGVVEWQKTYGGTFRDLPSKIVEKPNGYFLAGTSSSEDTGIKNIPSKGGFSDWWILEIDYNGNLLNQFVIGGDGWDALSDMVLLPNGNYLICGASDSDISGDKIQAGFGSSDYWVVECTPQMQIVNSKVFGGDLQDVCTDILITNSGQIILIGYSSSSISGNKLSQPYGDTDIWMVAVSDSLTFMWDQTHGGNSSESNFYIQGFQIEPTGDIIIGTTSTSDNTGNKSIKEFGNGDIWAIGVDTLGFKKYEYVAGGTDVEFFNTVAQDSTGHIHIGGLSRSSISGNKTEASRGNSDFWLFTLEFIVSVEKIESPEWSLYPNPAQTLLNISYPSNLKVESIQIINSLGQVVRTIKPISNEQRIELGSMASGIYHINIIGENFGYSKTVVIEN